MLVSPKMLADRNPPVWMRKAETAVLMKTFAHAFEVDPPSLRACSSDEALFAFRDFTAACMEAACADSAVAARYRARLGKGACGLGNAVRKLLHVKPEQAYTVTRFLYRGIEIEIEGSLPGALRFAPCSFARRYTPADCWFMSAFDEGFMRGITGERDAQLRFACRLSEGAPCCDATFGPNAKR